MVVQPNRDWVVPESKAHLMREVELILVKHPLCHGYLLHELNPLASDAGVLAMHIVSLLLPTLQAFFIGLDVDGLWRHRNQVGTRYASKPSALIPELAHHIQHKVIDLPSCRVDCVQGLVQNLGVALFQSSHLVGGRLGYERRLDIDIPTTQLIAPLVWWDQHGHEPWPQVLTEHVSILDGLEGCVTQTDAALLLFVPPLPLMNE